MKTTKLLCLVLGLLLLLSSLAACAGGKKEPTPTGTEATAETDGKTETSATTDQPVDPSMRYDVPSDLRFPDDDGGPNVVHILQRSAQKEVTDEMFSDGSGETAVEQAIYARQQLIASKLNVEFDYQYQSGAATTAQQQEFQARMKNINSSGVKEPWIVSGMIYSMPAVAGGTEGILLDLNTMKSGQTNYLDSEKIWWNQSVVSQATLNKKLYFAVSEANISQYNRMSVLMVNLTLAEQYCKDENGNPYDFRQLVYDKKWNYETFLSILTEVGAGDADNPQNSYWGLTTRNDSTTIDGFLLSSGIQITKVGEDGKPTAKDVFNTEWNKDRVKKIHDLYNTNQAVYKSNVANDVENPFLNGRAVFHANIMLALGQQNFREMKERFALLPLPKYDDVQEDYKVACHGETNAISVLSCTKNTELASAVLEMMAHESYLNVRPALFKDTYAAKSLQTPENEKMFYYLLDRSYLDFSQIYGQIFGLPLDYLRESVRYNKSIAETFDARESKTVNRLKDYVDKIWE